MPCEPLHNIKGHISHVLKELSSHLPKEATCEIDQIVQETVREHNRGCDCQKALFLSDSAVHGEELLPYSSGSVRRLLLCLAKIASIVYSREAAQCPQMVLHLSLSLRLHFQLLQEALTEPKSISKGALYGSYLHGLLALINSVGHDKCVIYGHQDPPAAM